MKSSKPVLIGEASSARCTQLIGFFDYLDIDSIFVKTWEQFQVNQVHCDLCFINLDFVGFNLKSCTPTAPSTPPFWIQLTDQATQGIPPGFSENLVFPFDLLEFQQTLERLQEKLDQVQLSQLSPEFTGSWLDRPLIKTRLKIEPSLVFSMIESFRLKAIPAIQQIKEALEQPDPEQLRQILHQVRGMFSNVGAARMARICQRLESESDPRALPDLPRWLAALDTAYVWTTLELEDLYAQLNR